MSSKDLAETIFRAQKLYNLVKQINSIDFCISQSQPNKIFIKDGKDNVDKEKPVLEIGDIDIPQEMIEQINSEKICEVLNDALEKAKFKLIKDIQISIFNNLNFEEPEDFVDEDKFISI